MIIQWKERSAIGLSNLSFIVLLNVLVIFSIYPSDVIVPSLPIIGPHLNASSNQIQLAVSIFLLASSLFQIICGILNAKIGTKTTLMIGITLFTIGALVAAAATNVSHLYIGRFLQGLGSASFLVLARFYLRLCFTNRQALAHVSSLFMISVSLTIALAPIAGGCIDQLFGWRWIFWTMGGIGILLALLYGFALPKDEASHKNPIKISDMMDEIRNYKFMRHVAVVGLNLGFMMIYYTMIPFTFEHVLHISPKDVGFLAALTCIPTLIGSIIIRVLAKRYSPNFQILIGQMIMFVATSVMVAFAFSHIINLWVVVTPFLVSVLGTSLIFTNGFIAAFENAKNTKIATGVYGTFQFLLASAVNALSTLFHEQNTEPMTMIMLTITVVSLVIHLQGCSNHRNRKKA